MKSSFPPRQISQLTMAWTIRELLYVKERVLFSNRCSGVKSRLWLVPTIHPSNAYPRYWATVVQRRGSPCPLQGRNKLACANLVNWRWVFFFLGGLSVISTHDAGCRAQRWKDDDVGLLYKTSTLIIKWWCSRKTINYIKCGEYY